MQMFYKEVDNDIQKLRDLFTNAVPVLKEKFDAICQAV